MAASPNSTTFSINSVTYTAITTVTQCKTVYIAEDASVASHPTTDLLFRLPSNVAGSTVRITIGLGFSIVAPGIFKAATIVGYVATQTGTTTAMQVETG